MNETIVENFNKLIIYYQSEKNSMDNPKAISFKIRNFQRKPNKIRYFQYVITPKGIAERTKLTINFMKRKIKEYDELKKELKKKK